MTINNNVGRADGLIRTDDVLAALVQVTADVRRGLTKRRILDWFHAHYQDPAHHTSVDEGEYLWNHGGPYDAREEIEAKFPHASQRVIDVAVEALEEEFSGWEWAGVPDHDAP